jgi:hypothetical protein
MLYLCNYAMEARYTHFSLSFHQKPQLRSIRLEEGFILYCSFTLSLFMRGKRDSCKPLTSCLAISEVRAQTLPYRVASLEACSEKRVSLVGAAIELGGARIFPSILVFSESHIFSCLSLLDLFFSFLFSLQHLSILQNPLCVSPHCFN